MGKPVDHDGVFDLGQYVQIALLCTLVPVFYKPNDLVSARASGDRRVIKIIFKAED